MQATANKILQGSPGLAEKMVASSKSVTKTASGNRDEKDTIIQDLMKQLEGEREKNRSLEDQYKFRVASFVKRETMTKNKIESLERRLNEGADHDEHEQRMLVIENMHKSVVAGIECIQNNTAKILQDQERELMRAFRARLQEVSKDLQAQNMRKGDQGTELQARHRRVVAELHEAQELAQDFDRKNQQLQADNSKLLDRLRQREDDRQALYRELYLSRKEAMRFKAQCKEGSSATGEATGEPAQARDSESQHSKSKRNFSQRTIDQAKQQQSHNKQYEREVRYREAVQRLKRMVEAERKTCRALRQQQAEMLQHRTELEVLLRQCLDDVKAEIMRHRLEHQRKDGPLPNAGQPVTSMSINELTAQDRERVLELLLSQQRVVQLLYSKTLPSQPPAPLVEDPTALQKNAKEDDFSWLSDIIPPEA